MNTPLKHCCRCGRELPGTREYFYADKRSSDGLYGHCKACHNAAVRKRYEGDRREKTLKAQRQYREAFPERRKAVVKRYYLRHKDEHRERTRKQEQKSTTKIRRRVYRLNNLARYRTLAKNRYALEGNLPNDFTESDWQFALNYFGHCCAVCERPLNGLFHKPHADHWIPVSSQDCPGSVPTNIVPLCGGVGGCNQSKHARDPQTWLLQKLGDKQGRAILAKVQEFFSQVRQV